VLAPCLLSLFPAKREGKTVEALQSCMHLR
jgi:hypothetical protein